MTDQDKLKKLFEAALKDSSDPSKAPTRSFPNPAVIQEIPVTNPVASPRSEVFVAVPQPDVEEVQSISPGPQAGLDQATAEELGTLLDDQRSRLSRKRRRDTVVLLGVVLSLSGVGYGWFVQSPQRVQAFKEAIRDIRSVGDVATMVAKYQQSLDRVAVRGQQIEQATAAMGVKVTAADEADPYMEAEMSAMMGGEGKTVGARNKALKDNFGQMQKKHGADAAIPVSNPKMKAGEDFGWEK